MSPETLSCPYCNTSVILAHAVEAGQRIQCPRCQELFPYRTGERGRETDEGIETHGLPLIRPQPDGLAEPSSPERRTNWSVAVVILALMASMAVIGLLFAWRTTEDRRKRDNAEQAANAELTRVISIAPAKLAALGYLPADTNVLAGLHFAELMGHAAILDFLVQARPESTLGSIHSVEQWSGIPLSDIDHAVLGLSVEERLIPRIVMVVQTRQPYDAEKVRSTLKAERRTERGKRTLYRFNLNQTAIEAVLWFAGERTLVLALIPEDLDNVPLTPDPGIERFSFELQKLLTEQLQEGTPAWIVGHAGDWTRVLSPQPLPGMPKITLVQLAKKEREILSGLRTFGSWLQVDAEVVWHLAVEGKDEAAARKLADYLARNGLNAEEPLQLFGQQPRAERLAQELSKSLTHRQVANWVRFQAKSTVEAIRQASSP
jgi:hypothetical protein